MSRCFPYPPPGYVRIGTSGGEAKALIDSIKIERANEKSRKDRKKEKKEKKRKKEEKSKHNALGESDCIRKKLDCVGVNGKLNDAKKSFKDEVEQLEKSDITEELGLAAPSDSLCYTSDGTHSSTKKRRRGPPSSETASIRKEGNIIRIMLPLKKHREPVVPLVEKTETCPSVGRNDSEVPSTSGRAEVPAENGPSSLKPQSARKEKQTPESLYNALICNCVPRPLHYQSLDQDDDENWLLKTKRQDRKDAVTIKNIQLPIPASTGFRPIAHFLPEANIYALPFSVPF